MSVNDLQHKVPKFHITFDRKTKPMYTVDYQKKKKEDFFFC